MAMIFRPPPQNPLVGGLYAAASVVEVPDPTRLATGVTVHGINCGPSGVWDIDYCAAPTDPEVQQVTLTGATAGTFTLTYAGATTAPIAYNATAAAVRSALEALPNLDAGDVTVTGTGPWTVTFVGVGGDVPQMSIDASGTTGGTGSVATLTEGGVKGGDRAADGEFTGLIVWAVDDCGTGAPETEQRDRAQQLLRLKERVHVEEETVPVLQTKAGAPTAGTSLVDAVGRLELTLGGFGFAGTIHASAALAAEAADHNLIVRSGTTLLTPLGHKWAFGAGYGALGSTLVGTGPVTVHRGPVLVNTGLAHRTNERLVVAEREVAVAWECVTTAVTTGA